MSKRDIYIENLKAQIDIWNAQVDKFEAQAKQASVSAKAAYEEQIKLLHQQRDLAKAKFTEIQTASDGAWEDLRQGADAAWDALRQNLEKAMSRFK
jgi:hypothetical protein